MRFREFGFRVLIAIDMLANVLTLGRVGICISTRAYIKANLVDNPTKFWIEAEKVIDKIMMEEGHCLKSFAWELNRQRNWTSEHEKLLRGKR
jgi:hypothetical protein